MQKLTMNITMNETILKEEVRTIDQAKQSQSTGR